MSDTATLQDADNAIDATTEAKKFVKWALKFDGVDAHIVYDYLPITGPDGTITGYEPGRLNGVTLQWDHDGDGNPDGAVHVKPGGTATRTDGGFDVTLAEVSR